MNFKEHPFIRHGTLVSVITLLMISIVMILNQQQEALRHDRSIVIHTQWVLSHVQLLFTKLEDAVLGQRGYIITSNPEYLEPYNNALKDAILVDYQDNVHTQHLSIAQETTYLRTLTADDPVQQHKLDELENDEKELLKYLAYTIRLHKAVHPTDLQKLDPNYGKQLMDGIREEINALSTEENRLLAIHTQHDEVNTRLGTLLIFSCITLCYLSTLLTIWVVARRKTQLEL